MSEQPKTKAPAPENSSEMEYVYDAVPQSARKSVGSILVILTGYTISLSNFVTGATVGFKMPFKEAVLACAVGNLMLILVATLLGVIAYKTGAGQKVPGRPQFFHPLPAAGGVRRQLDCRQRRYVFQPD